MWKKIKDTSYYIDVVLDNGYEVYITDFVKIWSYSSSQELFIECLMNSEGNYGLEIDREELLHKGTKLLLSPEKLCYAHMYEREFPDSAFLVINLAMDFGFELSLEMNLLLGSAKLFFVKVTQPLLSIVQDLKQSENDLRELVLKKDEEITEYKTQGGKIKYTALQPYNDGVHMQKHQCYNNFFDSIEDPQNILNKTIDKRPETPSRELKQPAENIPIKEEPSSETIDSSQTNNKFATNNEQTGYITIKAEISSKSVTPNEANHLTTKEHTDRTQGKVEVTEDVNSTIANNLVMSREAEVKEEFKPSVPKKKKLNI